MILIIPDNINQIADNVNYYDGVILSLDKFSVNTRYKVSLEKLKDIITLLDNKEIFVSINKNIENHEIDDLEKILLELNKFNIKGLIYVDTAILTYKGKLNYDLVWGAEHLVTNYETVNYWHHFGVNYAYVSSDITKKEINEISKNTSCQLLTNLFGYLPMFTSKRHIVKNYLKQFNLKDNSKVNYIEKENKKYPILDSDHTCVFSNNIYNGIKEFFNINTDYYVCNGFLIDNFKFSEVLKIISNITLKNVEDCHCKVNELFSDIDSAFLYQETVSKVKK